VITSNSNVVDFLFIQNPFTQKGLEYWIHQSFSFYCQPPNPTNVKLEIEPGDTNFDTFVLQKLRWATLGYHHNWDTKEYSESFRGEFPSDLSKLSKTFASCLGFDRFMPEAAIVNYYSLDSTLGGHTDHSEINLEAPLFSISFGQSAIFLLGGTQKSEKPSALFIRNGDVAIMSGKSRLCYHAIPKIVRDPNFYIDGKDCVSFFLSFIKHSNNLKKNIRYRSVVIYNVGNATELKCTSSK